MKKPTKDQTAAEIAALKKLVPVGLFARKTAASIEIAIEALNDEVDETSDEFNVELTDEQREMAMDAINWKNGVTSHKPSEGWGGLVR